MNLIKNELDADLADEWNNASQSLLLLHQIVRLLRILTNTNPVTQKDIQKRLKDEKAI